MKKKDKKIFLSKKVLFVGCIFFILFVANLSTWFFVQFDQFSLFYKYDETYSLIDWNLPHVVREFIDSDGKQDTIMYTGCIFLSTVPASSIPLDRQCTNNIVENGKMVGTQMPILYKKLINTYLGRKDNSWDMVVHYLGETKLYRISPAGELIEEKVPITLKLDSLLYSLTHLYAIIF